MPDAVPTLFPLTRCPACGYALTGLPDAGRCPECGESYDNTIVILFGWPPSRFQSPGTTVVYVAALCFAIFLGVDAGIGLIAVILSLVKGLWTNAWFALLFTLAYTGAAAALFFLARWSRRRKRRHITNPESLGIPSLQLRLSPLGYAVRHGYGSVHYLHWIPNLECDLSRDGLIAHLRIARLTPVGTTDWSTIVNIAFPASNDQVAALSSHLDTLRHSQPSAK